MERRREMENAIQNEIDRVIKRAREIEVQRKSYFDDHRSIAAPAPLPHPLLRGNEGASERDPRPTDW